ncbi:MAG: AtpZ/AtpI family protein [Candidatus Aminicenantes bacterium]|nr:AtpZ/AtpI family protein [Candidatus Aminicenantes bacterium]
MRDRRSGLLSLRRWTELSSLGLMLPSSIVVGLVFGWLFDKAFGTGPWGLLAFFVLGAVSGVVSLFRALAKYDKDEKE